MKSYLRVGAAVLAATSLAGCATVTRTPNTTWSINTVPEGARVQMTNGYYCDYTPCSVTMPRRSTFTATITHMGYKPAAVQVTNHLSAEGGAAFLGNALIGGVIGAGLDIATGATLDLTPNASTVALERDAGLTALVYGTTSAAYDTDGSTGLRAGETVTINRF